MAVLQGRNGLIKFQLPASPTAAPVALTGTLATDLAAGTLSILGDIRSWSLDETVETVDATVMSTSTGFIFRDLLPSFKAWTASADVLFDPTTSNIDVGQNAQFRSGVTVNVYIFPAGDDAGASTDPVFWGKALITSKSASASYDGLVEVSVTLEGRGTLYVAETA
jgi:hypothetical protein